MNETSPYKRLAERLDALPNGFPATEDGAEIRVLEALFTPEQAALAAQLRLTLETPREIAARTGGEPRELRAQLKEMARQGLIKAGRAGRGLGYGLLPFVVGIYEMQVERIDAEFAQLFEDYYHRAFGEKVAIEPSIHRVIPVQESVRMDMEIRPFESAAEIVRGAKAWGVLDCLCRKQQALIGKPCGHPIDVCMILSERPGAFDHNPAVQALTEEEALATLHRAAEAGLVHSVSNYREEITYICNCCTCACGLLRGMSELGLANVIAKSAFVNEVDEGLCIGCGICVESCQFDALTVEGVARVDVVRCVGCGVCALACPEGALHLVRRPEEEVIAPPADEEAWMVKRATARGIDLDEVL